MKHIENVLIWAGVLAYAAFVVLLFTEIVGPMVDRMP